MGTTPIEIGARNLRVAPLTVDQYEAMAEKGIIPAGTPIELVAGMLVFKDRSATGADPMTIGTDHASAVDVLSQLSGRFAKFGCYLATQRPIRIAPRDEPEPDGAVVQGSPFDYRKRHPTPGSIHAVIEVADSSLAADLSTKLAMYATAAIPQYIVVNLVDSRVETFADPVAKDGRYRTHVLRAGSQIVSISAGGRRSIKVKAKDLLP